MDNEICAQIDEIIGNSTDIVAGSLTSGTGWTRDMLEAYRVLSIVMASDNEGSDHD